jgi:hypothetical protein
MHFSTAIPPQTSNDVMNQNNEVVGKVVRSAPAPIGGYDVLAEIRLDSVEGGDLIVNGIKGEIQQLPYGLQNLE